MRFTEEKEIQGFAAEEVVQARGVTWEELRFEK